MNIVTCLNAWVKYVKQFEMSKLFESMSYDHFSFSFTATLLLNFKWVCMKWQLRLSSNSIHLHFFWSSLSILGTGIHRPTNQSPVESVQRNGS